MSRPNTAHDRTWDFGSIVNEMGAAFRQLAMTGSKIAALLSAFMMLSTVPACLNDRDSLNEEVTRTGLRDDVWILVGWFDVHSPLYYEMRIKRCLSELKSNPGSLELYDDAAVALDRIGQDDRAIAVIERKAAYMRSDGIKERKLPDMGSSADWEIVKEYSRDPWYRYYANVGTFWVHRWAKAGMPASSKRKSLDRAQQFIDHAIKLNPYAHGNREYAQAAAIRWLRLGKPGQTLGSFLEQSGEFTYADAYAAVIGLIELGGAWQSVDVYEAIGSGLSKIGNGPTPISQIAYNRVDELQKAGFKSITGRRFTIRVYPAPNRVGAIQDDYKWMRRVTEEWRSARLDYEVKRLKTGKHPDSDPYFWKEFNEPNSHLSIPKHTEPSLFESNNPVIRYGLLSAAGLVIVFGLVKLTSSFSSRIGK